MANTTSLQTLKEMLGAEWQIGEDCVYTESDNGVRVEVAGICSESRKNYFNVYVTRDGDEIAQSVAVPQEALIGEVEVLRKLAPQ